ncbi:hypothetical protein E2C01_025606 [Portunus trituberculatus]|uniref:Uncharacterized protein n=1 Tax=Portunus trituberculatus TaxID=210409 RepID=A0A5B7EG63_PORTR|nr:hypothetical protein [Portunus trituberculatus]
MARHSHTTARTHKCSSPIFSGVVLLWAAAFCLTESTVSFKSTLSRVTRSCVRDFSRSPRYSVAIFTHQLIHHNKASQPTTAATAGNFNSLSESPGLAPHSKPAVRQYFA